MRILVDADALPRAIREVLIRAAEREQLELVLVANRPQRLAGSSWVHSIVASGAFNGADDRIVEEAAPGDLVITADIPLADRVITARAEALNPNGELFSTANIKTQLAMRDLFAQLRSTGEISGGSPPFSSRDKERFTNALNKILTAAKKRDGKP